MTITPTTTTTTSTTTTTTRDPSDHGRGTAEITERSTGRRFVRITVTTGGVIAAAIGTAIVVAPRSFLDIDDVASADLLSETRAPGAMLMAAGVVLILAAWRRRHLMAAAWLATLLYLGYSVGRIISVIFDGWPSATIIGATIIEVVVGSASLAALRITLRSDLPPDQSPPTSAATPRPRLLET